MLGTIIVLNDSQRWPKEGYSSIEKEESFFHCLLLDTGWDLICPAWGSELYYSFSLAASSYVFEDQLYMYIIYYTHYFDMAYILIFIRICVYTCIFEGDGEVQWLVDSFCRYVANILSL